MAITTNVKDAMNAALKQANLKLDTLTAQKHEAARISRLLKSGHFDRPAYPILPSIADVDLAPLSDAYATFRDGVDKLMRGGAQPGGFDPTNTFYRSPDAEILYLMVRSRRPKRIVEVGSGNSSRIVRQAICDGGLLVEHIAIDPEPRSDITGLVDNIQLSRFEDAEADAVLSRLEANDILFIDSSHEVRVANDVAKLFCVTIPSLAPGVVIHVHDIFLPFDYPEPFCTNYSGWGEQYMLQVLLQGRARKVLWPGYYVQRMRPELCTHLPFVANGRAQSFWFVS